MENADLYPLELYKRCLCLMSSTVMHVFKIQCNFFLFSVTKFEKISILGISYCFCHISSLFSTFWAPLRKTAITATQLTFGISLLNPQMFLSCSPEQDLNTAKSWIVHNFLQLNEKMLLKASPGLSPWQSYGPPATTTKLSLRRLGVILNLLSLSMFPSNLRFTLVHLKHFSKRSTIVSRSELEIIIHVFI